jgi:hypothetical protein
MEGELGRLFYWVSCYSSPATLSGVVKQPRTEMHCDGPLCRKRATEGKAGSEVRGMEWRLDFFKKSPSPVQPVSFEQIPKQTLTSRILLYLPTCLQERSQLSTSRLFTTSSTASSAVRTGSIMVSTPQLASSSGTCPLRANRT